MNLKIIMISKSSQSKKQFRLYDSIFIKFGCCLDMGIWERKEGAIANMYQNMPKLTKFNALLCATSLYQLYICKALMDTLLEQRSYTQKILNMIPFIENSTVGKPIVDSCGMVQDLNLLERTVRELSGMIVLFYTFIGF